MMPATHGHRMAAAALLAALALALAGCLLTPGKFTSSLDIRRDGRFALAYSGEIHMLALSKLAQMETSRDREFAPTTCYADDGSGEQRTCSAEEIAAQRSAWESRRAGKAREAEQMKAMLGGIDPADPKAAEEFAQRLRRQVGWRKVDYKGDGLFEVDFALSGTLSHDLAFPTIERFPMAFAFLTLSRHSDGTVRMDAPGFGASQSGEPWKSMFGGMAAMKAAGGAGATDEAGRGAALFPLTEGSFTITTDGEVLSNNTDEGPRPDPAGRKLSWTINPRSQASPMAVIRLDGQ